MKNILIAAALAFLAATFTTGAAAQNKPVEYRLGDGDSIRVLVFQNPELTLETRVTESGTITYPLIGNLAIGGMTIPGAEQAIAKALSDGGFIQRPQVNIVLLQNRGNQVSVLGQVGRPGRYALETFTTRLSEMIAIAGGIGPIGADTAIVTGMREGKPFRMEIDIAGMFLNNHLQDDVVVAGGDVIFIQRQPMYYIYGQVQRAGSFRIERNMTIRQALASSGGLTARGTERRLGVYRRGINDRIEFLITDMNESVRANDVLYVRESLF
ncbi:MAG: polysaccharide export protein EpsE [Burkholderiales bacterium]|nr:polysaccharide export protein EpsE [Burkholderiales bacterium]MDP2398590.1 polysaccharide export protein EpsE [Burkholderiales bacterium]